MVDACFLDWGAKGLSDGIRTGELTSAGILSACLQRIERRNPELHAFVKVFPQAASERARKLDAEIAEGHWRGPLHGLPVAIKDLVDIEGEVTGFGSRCYSTRPATGSAAIIDRLEKAGAIIIGKTHTVEFAFGSWGTNHALGTPVNPATPGHCAPGGSSSGSAVAVASGMVPLAIGSDTGGSVRIPAALCGIAGLKTSHGLVSLEGVAPLCPVFDTIGPLARDVEGLRMLLDGLRPANTDVKRYDGAVTYRLVPDDFLHPVDCEILALRDAFIAGLTTQGARIEHIQLPRSLENYQSLCGKVMAHDAYQALHEIIDDQRLPVDPMVRRRIAAGQTVSGLERAQLLEQREKDSAIFLEGFGKDDVLVLPSTPFPACPVSRINEDQIPMSRFTRVANYLDLATVSLPLGRVGGAPVGLQLAMRAGQDDRLLALLIDGGFADMPLRTGHFPLAPEPGK